MIRRGQAVLNTDKNAYLAAKRRKEQTSEIDELKNRIERLERLLGVGEPDKCP